MTVEVRWDNYRTEANDTTEYPGTSMQITFNHLRTQNGETIAVWCKTHDVWERGEEGHPDGHTQWTDIAW